MITDLLPMDYMDAAILNICFGLEGDWVDSLPAQPNSWTLPATPTVPLAHENQPHISVAPQSLDDIGLEDGGKPVQTESEDPDDAPFEDDEGANVWMKYGELSECMYQ